MTTDSGDRGILLRRFAAMRADSYDLARSTTPEDAP